MQRIGLRLAYDGTRFFGFQRQPDKRTVEGELVGVLQEIGAIRDTGSSSYRLSSRTDRGVSALGNIISIDTEFPRKQLPKAINSMARDLWCTGTCDLPKDLDVRRAVGRTYAYYLHDEGQDLAAMQKACKLLVGKHDFSYYARLDGRNPVRTITAFKMRRKDTVLEFLISGESFLWNQVRRMVWAVDRVGRGSSSPSNISPEHFSLRKIGAAPAENLVLVKVDIGYPFDAPEQIGRPAEEVRSRLVSSLVRARLFEGILVQFSKEWHSDR
jgi:tRNA pseudouridine38-40 synthase